MPVQSAQKNGEVDVQRFGQIKGFVDMRLVFAFDTGFAAMFSATDTGGVIGSVGVAGDKLLYL